MNLNLSDLCNLYNLWVNCPSVKFLNKSVLFVKGSLTSTSIPSPPPVFSLDDSATDHN